MRVLLVEDELLISMMLEDEITDLGHRVTGVATTVEGGLALLRSTSPDFAFVDFQLADGNCYDLIAELKTRQIPFALVTGARIDRADARLEKVDVLAKPVDMDRLTAVLEQSTRSLEDHASTGGGAPFSLTLTLNAAKG
jgi:DNA-binding response OmpR family regulator